MNKVRLDQALVARGMVSSRSQAESYIKLGKVRVEGKVVEKPGYFVDQAAKITLEQEEQYVSRAGLKLAGAADKLNLSFKDKIVLDVGSSTGGFTDYALKHGAKKVIAVDVGTNQLHPSLRGDGRIELIEQTDIRDLQKLSAKPDLVVTDVSFISLREVLPAVAKLAGPKALILAMAKPQFEAGSKDMRRGIIKNDSVRRQILKNFEQWAKEFFIVEAKADSLVAGAKGNLERFYLLRLKS